MGGSRSEPPRPESPPHRPPDGPSRGVESRDEWQEPPPSVVNDLAMQNSDSKEPPREIGAFLERLDERIDRSRRGR